MKRDFIDLCDQTSEDLRGIVDDSRRRKAARRSGGGPRPLRGKTLALIFERPSTRTRVSFDVGMRDLGGETIVLTGAEMQLGRGETIADTARVLSRYVDGIMIRALDHDMVVELARHATVPVINGLTRVSHPCQIMADVMTFEEHRGDIAGRRIAWLGASNNVLTSWVHGAARFGFSLTVAAPAELAPPAELISWARAAGADVRVFDTVEPTVDGAHCVVTDTWVSMGDDGADRRREILEPFQVTEQVMALASDDALFMHCLPAHRGEEVVAGVIDGPHSVVFDEAENRLHAQKGILAWCLDADAA